MTNQLYYGDNLHILREHIADESVDLIYLDPPFNSKRDYNLLFKTPKGMESDAQITAFEDTWHWGEQAENEFRELKKQANTDVAQMMEALRGFLGENDMMAYLTMMANRLLELHRVLKPTGSLYLHCDPTASHYLKIVLDGVFGKFNFRNDIVWKRRYGTFSTVHESTKFGACTDNILFYVKGDGAEFHPQYSFDDPTYQDYVEKTFRHIDKQGRRYRIADLANPAPRPNLMYEYKGYKPPKNGWAISKEKMELWDKEGRLHFPKEPEGRIQRRRFFDELKGKPVQSLWDDIDMISSQSDERLGYPTQKPLALLERIIKTSSNEGDVVLDPFCGCGTAVHAAQMLGRRWIGIDITHLAVSLIEKRLKQAFPELDPNKSKAPSPQPSPADAGEGVKPTATRPPRPHQRERAGGEGEVSNAVIGFEVIGIPQDLDAARDLAERDKHEFQLWACTLVGAQPYKGGKKGMDQGIDGLIFPEVGKGKSEKIIVSVKGGEHRGSSFIRDLKGVLEREKAVIGLYVGLAPPTKEMIKEAASAGHYESPHHGAFPKIQLLTIEGLLNGSERPRFPDMSLGGGTFKAAKTEGKKTEQKGLF